jgi:hypothetical protein
MNTEGIELEAAIGGKKLGDEYIELFPSNRRLLSEYAEDHGMPLNFALNTLLFFVFAMIDDGRRAWEDAEGTSLSLNPDVVDNDEDDDKATCPAAKQSTPSSPPEQPQKKRSGKNTMNDSVLRDALKSAARVYHGVIMKSPAQVYNDILEDYPDTYCRAEELACEKAASHYIWESGLDRIKTRSSSIIAELRKMGWLPPRYSKLEHRVEFFTSLGERVEQGRTWDYPPLEGYGRRTVRS